MLCDQCGFAAHSKCANNAPLTCDLRATRNSGSHFGFLGPTSRNKSTDRASTTGTNPDSGKQPTPNPTTAQPSAAYKVLTAFKRSRPLSLEPATRSTPSVNSLDDHRERRISLPPPNLLRQKDKEVARLLFSNGSSPGPSNHGSKGRDSNTGNTRRSVGTRSESVTSRVDEAARKSKITRSSVISVESGRGYEEVSPTDIPDELPPPPTTSKRRTSKKSDGCLIQ